ncbi:predicted protein [Sclerotinia sclerotiorum 1980 UF-70]|uniref:Uncharacterized protein n=1 Tax=Sclerotinia sclerotiorum (strain ATCC 18683 / 1980 / Ss-1) TaxID=665079 RepID=A7F4J5_SCLS1|nr:predicted protein [Sclerotinia sclerotiorum 1980 UF-70]EDN97666.1 predicted protein [Sclerotinia sclerotiorum 1980 UF-70]
MAGRGLAGLWRDLIHFKCRIHLVKGVDMWN